MNTVRIGDGIYHPSTQTYFSVEDILADGCLKVSWDEGNGLQFGCLSNYDNEDYQLWETVRNGVL